MSQQSIIGRITQLARANINALLDQAEDPQKMLDQMVRDYTSAISDAEGAVAQTIGNLRMMEEDARGGAKSAASQWGAKATAASKKADDMRAAGSTAEADKFDNLARVALRPARSTARADARRCSATHYHRAGRMSSRSSRPASRRCARQARRPAPQAR